MLIALRELTIQERRQNMYEWKAEHDGWPGGDSGLGEWGADDSPNRRRPLK